MHHHRLANRGKEIEIFDQMAAGSSRQRILLLEGDGGLGKTTLLTEFVRRCPETVTVASVDLKGSPALHEILARLCEALGWQNMPAFTACIEHLLSQATSLDREMSDFQHIHREIYDLGAVHDLLIDAFTAQDLRRFCLYHRPFDDILPRFAAQAGLEDMVEAVIEHCQQYVLLSDLLLAIRQKRFGHYKRHYGRLYDIAEPEIHALRPASSWGIGRAEIEAALHSADEGSRATRRGALTRAFFEDLASRPGQKILVFDTYEHADPEVKDWLAGPCPVNVQRIAHLAVTIAGRQVPQACIEWAAAAHHLRLAQVEDAATWEEYARHKGWDVPRAWIEGFCVAVNGHPGQIDALLASVARRGAGQ